MKSNIRLMYLYLFSFIGLLITVVGTIQLVNLGMKAFIFRDADIYDYTVPIKEDGGVTINIEEERERQEIQTKRQRQREFSNAASMIIIGGPLYFYHWKTIQKEKVE